MSTPTLYLSNWSSHRTPGMHGPGRKWTIMARPRAWERGDGVVRLLRPTGIVRDLMDDALRERREHGDDLALGAYRAAYIGRLDGLGVDALQPEDAGDGMIRFSALCAGGMDEGPVIGVRDGDTLCCACSVAESRAGRCHRSWAAPFLARAGWNVILDGVPFVVPK